MNFQNLLNSNGWWFIFIFVCLGTYFWRGLGVLISGHVSQDSEVFKWLSCVTYAMVSALTFKLILFPVGLLSHVPLWYRVFVSLLCLGVILTKPGRLIPTLMLGCALMMVFGLYSLS